MRIEGTRQGTLIGNLDGAMAFNSFRPAPLQNVVPLSLNNKGQMQLAACSRKLGELAGIARSASNIQMYLTMYVRKEALLSAQIEGTQCTLDDVLDPDNQQIVHQDISEVISYIKALEFAVRRMDNFPLCLRLLRETHAILLKNTRGEDKTPGEIRTSQNWIGPAGCLLNEAAYVPPSVPDMHDALSALDEFINGDFTVDPLVKTALVHYQFETIHPFLDGNGRLGRLLITLMLLHEGVLKPPVLYPSYELKMRRTEYYERLTAVRERGDFEGWVTFFCACLAASADDAIASMDRLAQIHSRSEAKIRAKLGRGLANGLRLLEFIEGHPIVDIPYITRELGLARSSVTALVNEFVEMNILKMRDERRQRYRTYLYEEYLEVLRSGVEPLR